MAYKENRLSKDSLFYDLQQRELFIHRRQKLLIALRASDLL